MTFCVESNCEKKREKKTVFVESLIRLGEFRMKMRIRI